MEINKRDDYSGNSNFHDIDDFSSWFLEEEENSIRRVEADTSFYRKVEEY